MPDHCDARAAFDTLIVHAAWSPRTGVWALIQNLARWQVSHMAAHVRLALFDSDRIYLARLRDAAQRTSLQGEFFACLRTPFQRLIALLDYRLQAYIEQQTSALSVKHVVVHFHNSHFSAVFLPLKAPEKTSLHSVVTFHGCPSGLLRKHPVKSLVHGYLKWRLASSSVHKISVSSAEIPLLAQVMAYPTQSFSVVHNGVFLPANMVSPRYPERWLMKVGFVGTFDENKRWWLAAEGVTLARRSGASRCQMVLAGSGKGSERARQWASDHSDFAAFLGEVPDAAASVIPDLDVLILPSQREGIPMVVLEALAAGVPVIATPIGGVPEVIQSGRNGFLVEPTVEAIADRIVHLYSHGTLLSQMRAWARSSCAQSLSIDACGQQYSQEYMRLTGQEYGQ